MLVFGSIKIITTIFDFELKSTYFIIGPYFDKVANDTITINIWMMNTLPLR